MDIEKLKQKILDLAIKGKLVPQDPNDEPASVLIEKIREEKAKLVKEGKIKASKEESYIYKGSDNCYYEKNIVLSDALNYIQPSNYIVHSTDYDDSYAIPVLTPGKSFILGYTNETEGIYDASIKNVIIFDDFTTATKYVDFKFKVKSSAMKILVSRDENLYNIKYFYYLLNTIHVLADSHKRFWISEYQPLRVKIPPFWYQTLVVDYVDVLFHKLNLIDIENKKLEDCVELAKRKILDMAFGENSSYKSYYKNYSKLGDLISTISSLNKEEKTQDVLLTGKYPVVSQSKTLIDGYSNNSNKVINDFPVIIFGDHTRVVKYIDFQFIPGADGTKIIKPQNLIEKYIYYSVLYASQKIENRGYGRHFAKLKEVLVPIPYDEKQQEIIDYLEKAFALLDSIE